VINNHIIFKHKNNFKYKFSLYNILQLCPAEKKEKDTRLLHTKEKNA